METLGHDTAEHVDRAFLFEIRFQLGCAHLATEQIEAALAASNTERVHAGVQALLVAAGILALVFWPADRFAPRGDRMRRLLGVVDESPLRRARAFRHNLEHFDERLEAWARESTRHNIVDQSIMPAGAITGIDPGDFLRVYDPTTHEVTFRGERLALPPLITELAALAARVDRAIDSHFERTRMTVPLRRPGDGTR